MTKYKKVGREAMEKHLKVNAILTKYNGDLYNAGPKAKIDIENILSKEFDFRIEPFAFSDDRYNNILKRMFSLIKKTKTTKRLCKNIKIAIFQNAFTTKKFLLKKFKKKIIIIHDIEGIRFQNEKSLEREMIFFKSCDYIIAHNDRMKDFLVERGIEHQKIYKIELFDYLCNDKNHICENNEKIVKPIIAYTGNLNKANFIDQLQEDKMNFILDLYGTKTKEIENKKIIYKGRFLPEELPNVLNEELGLVWDGNLDESDEFESYKFYTKYNTPHKISCYIAAGLPVIVWKKSAIAEFVRKFDIGYEVSNLYEINNLDFSDYYKKKKNATSLSLKVRNGYFTKQVISQILNKINNDSLI